jgi:hypothetical protein
MLNKKQYAALASIALSVLATPTASADCTGPMPVPATTGFLQCTTSQNAPRCTSALSRNECREMNLAAFEMGLVTGDAYLWLNGWDIPQDTRPLHSRVPNGCAIVVRSLLMSVCPSG